jgi:NADP-dependent 3-hydroxy acid dehydrogenase YdfG
MSWPYKKVLVIGATSGIGEALAARCIQAGSSVIVSGRREEKLVDFVHQHGAEKATAAPFDITALDQIPEFATKCMDISPASSD